MSFSLFALLDMAPPSPSLLDSDSSREPSPVPFVSRNMPKANAIAANASSPLLKLPDDIFKCILDYLDGYAAWSLKRLCKGMASSTSVNQLLYKYPIKLAEVHDLRLGDWKYKAKGQPRWFKFKKSINDANRNYVHKLALSHWVSIEDFQWVEENLPSLTGLDISCIKDFVWTPEQTWTWQMLAEACPKLFGRIEELEVANWADYTAHARIEYSYSYNDYRFKQMFRISRRRGGGSVAKTIFPICKKMKLLAIRERYSGFHSWNEWEVHQRVCCLVDGVQKYCPDSMTKLRVHDYAPYRSLFSTDATAWSRLTDVEIGLYSWMEDRRERDVIGPIPYRITAGNHHREEENAFDDKTFEECRRNHMDLGTNVVQSVSASFEDLLQSLQTISKKYPKINIKPIHNLHNITLHPFHLVNVMQRRSIFAHLPPPNNPVPLIDPVSNKEVQHALRWLAQKCHWKPILAWDSMMCDVFPANLEHGRTFLPKADVLSRISAMVAGLRRLDIPIRISIGDRANMSPSSGLDGSLYFGDYKTFVGEGDDKHEVLLPTQASFNLSCIASMVDELTIQYPIDVPGVSGWLSANERPTPAEDALMQRERIGWRRFWTRYASQFKNLKKLTASIPRAMFDDWGKTELASLLADERWQMLEVEDWNGEYGFFDNSFPFSSSPLLRHSMRKHGYVKFVQRVFFRLDDQPLTKPDVLPQLTHLVPDDGEITDEHIADVARPAHRFWPQDDGMAKRKREAEDKDDLGAKRRRLELEGRLHARETLEHMDRTLEVLEQRF